MQKNPISESEELVMRSILHQNNDAYGVEIRDVLEEKASVRYSFSVIYDVLTRLEQKGFVSSRMGEVSPERGGRPKKYFRVEADGFNAIEEAERRRQALFFKNPTYASTSTFSMGGGQ